MSRNVDRDDFYFEVPRRFHDALARGEVTGRQFYLGCYISGAVHFKTGEVSLTRRALEDGCDWRFGDDALRRDLEALKPRWIDYDIRQGQRSPYVFRLTGLRRRETQLPHDFRTESPSPAEVTSRLRKSERSANPQPKSGLAAAQPLHGGSPREEKRREETKAGNEEELDHLGVETTAAGDDLLDAIERARLFDEMFPPKAKR